MYEFHGGFRLAESTVESDLGGLAVAADQLRTLLLELETPSYSASVDILNGQHYLIMTGHPNRNRTQFTDCVIDFLTANLPRSWGLLHERDDERLETPGRTHSASRFSLGAR